MNKEVTAIEAGERLRKLRGSRRMSDVAESIGVSTMAISQYENGLRIPKDRLKVAICNFYGVSVESIFYA